MRAASLFLTGLMVVGTLICHGAWALPGAGVGSAHAAPLHDHAPANPGHPGHPGHGSDDGAEACDLTIALKAPTIDVAAPSAMESLALALPAQPEPLAPVQWREPRPSHPLKGPPATPVRRHVVLLI